MTPMTDTPNLLIDRNLEAATIISLRREPACFAFLSASAVSAPIPIDSLNLDLASVDYYGGPASLWATLEIRSGPPNQEPTPLLPFHPSLPTPFPPPLIHAPT